MSSNRIVLKGVSQSGDFFKAGAGGKTVFSANLDKRGGGGIDFSTPQFMPGSYWELAQGKEAHFKADPGRVYAAIGKGELIKTEGSQVIKVNSPAVKLVFGSQGTPVAGQFREITNLEAKRISKGVSREGEAGWSFIPQSALDSLDKGDGAKISKGSDAQNSRHKLIKTFGADIDTKALPEQIGNFTAGELHNVFYTEEEKLNGFSSGKASLAIGSSGSDVIKTTDWFSTDAQGNIDGEGSFTHIGAGILSDKGKLVVKPFFILDKNQTIKIDVHSRAQDNNGASGQQVLYMQDYGDREALKVVKLEAIGESHFINYITGGAALGFNGSFDNEGNLTLYPYKDKSENLFDTRTFNINEFTQWDLPTKENAVTAKDVLREGVIEGKKLPLLLSITEQSVGIGKGAPKKNALSYAWALRKDNISDTIIGVNHALLAETYIGSPLKPGSIEKTYYVAEGNKSLRQELLSYDSKKAEEWVKKNIKDDNLKKQYLDIIKQGGWKRFVQTGIKHKISSWANYYEMNEGTKKLEAVNVKQFNQTIQNTHKISWEIGSVDKQGKFTPLPKNAKTFKGKTWQGIAEVLGLGVKDKSKSWQGVSPLIMQKAATSGGKTNALLGWKNLPIMPQGLVNPTVVKQFSASIEGNKIKVQVAAGEDKEQFFEIKSGEEDKKFIEISGHKFYGEVKEGKFAFSAMVDAKGKILVPSKQPVLNVGFYAYTISDRAGGVLFNKGTTLTSIGISNDGKFQYSPITQAAGLTYKNAKVLEVDKTGKKTAGLKWKDGSLAIPWSLSVNEDKNGNVTLTNLNYAGGANTNSFSFVVDKETHSLRLADGAGQITAQYSFNPKAVSSDTEDKGKLSTFAPILYRYSQMEQGKWKIPKDRVYFDAGLGFNILQKVNDGKWQEKQVVAQDRRLSYQDKNGKVIEGKNNIFHYLVKNLSFVEPGKEVGIKPKKDSPHAALKYTLNHLSKKAFSNQKGIVTANSLMPAILGFDQAGALNFNPIKLAKGLSYSYMSRWRGQMVAKDGKVLSAKNMSASQLKELARKIKEDFRRHPGRNEGLVKLYGEVKTLLRLDKQNSGAADLSEKTKRLQAAFYLWQAVHKAGKYKGLNNPFQLRRIEQIRALFTEGRISAPIALQLLEYIIRPPSSRIGQAARFFISLKRKEEGRYSLGGGRVAIVSSKGSIGIFNKEGLSIIAGKDGELKVKVKGKTVEVKAPTQNDALLFGCLLVHGPSGIKIGKGKVSLWFNPNSTGLPAAITLKEGRFMLEAGPHNISIDGGVIGALAVLGTVRSGSPSEASFNAASFASDKEAYLGLVKNLTDIQLREVSQSFNKDNSYYRFTSFIKQQRAILKRASSPEEVIFVKRGLAAVEALRKNVDQRGLYSRTFANVFITRSTEQANELARNANEDYLFRVLNALAKAETHPQIKQLFISRSQAFERNIYDSLRQARLINQRSREISAMGEVSTFVLASAPVAGGLGFSAFRANLLSAAKWGGLFFGAPYGFFDAVGEEAIKAYYLGDLYNYKFNWRRVGTEIGVSFLRGTAWAFSGSSLFSKASSVFNRTVQAAGRMLTFGRGSAALQQLIGQTAVYTAADLGASNYAAYKTKSSTLSWKENLLIAGAHLIPLGVGSLGRAATLAGRLERAGAFLQSKSTLFWTNFGITQKNLFSVANKGCIVDFDSKGSSGVLNYAGTIGKELAITYSLLGAGEVLSALGTKMIPSFAKNLSL